MYHDLMFLYLWCRNSTVRYQFIFLSLIHFPREHRWWPVIFEINKKVTISINEIDQINVPLGFLIPLFPDLLTNERIYRELLNGPDTLAVLKFFLIEYENVESSEAVHPYYIPILFIRKSFRFDKHGANKNLCYCGD